MEMRGKTLGLHSWGQHYTGNGCGQDSLFICTTWGVQFLQNETDSLMELNVIPEVDMESLPTLNMTSINDCVV